MNLALNILLWISYFISLYFSVFWFLVFLDDKLDRRRETKSRLKRFPIVSVIVPAYNEEDSIQGTLRSLINLDYPTDKLQLIVVNDGSKDTTEEVVQAFIKNHASYDIILINQENQGKGAALNTGLKHTKGEFFACLDADSFVQKETLKRMLRFYEEQGDDLVIATPIMKVKSPQTIIQRLQRIEYIIIMFVARLMSHIDCLFVAPGPFSLYRTQVIKGLGGFDTQNITEDQEIAYRVQSKHMKIRQCPGAYVETIAPHNSSSFYRQRNRWFRGGLMNVLKYKRLFWNTRYGDFGFVQMPVNLVLFFLAFVTLFFFSYYLFWPIIKGLSDLSLVGFDIWTYIINFSLYFNWLHMDIEKLFVIFSMFLISICMFIIAHKYSNEKVSRHGIVYLLPYFLVYYLALSLIAVIILVEMAVGKKEKW